ncbi:MAG: DUF4116 domain-containing protein [Pseudomonadota bacterium]|nr:DUF4116 domain-containing protein [Pseudomonadota bacterium]
MPFSNESLQHLTLQHNGLELKNIRLEEQDGQSCNTAVLNHPFALQYVREDLITYELCVQAVSTHGATLDFVPLEKFTQEQRIALYNLAVKSLENKDGCAIQYILKEDTNHIDDELYEEAVRDDARAIQYIPKEKISRSIINMALSDSGKWIKHIPHSLLTTKDWETAVQNYPEAIYEISLEKMTLNLYYEGLKNQKLSFNIHIPKKLKHNTEIQKAAVIGSGFTIDEIIHMNAGTKRSKQIKYLSWQEDDIALCQLAIEHHPNTCQWIPAEILIKLLKKHPNLMKMAFSAQDDAEIHSQIPGKSIIKNGFNIEIAKELAIPDYLARAFTEKELSTQVRGLTEKQKQDTLAYKQEHKKELTKDQIDSALHYGKISPRFPKEEFTPSFCLKMSIKHGKSWEWGPNQVSPNHNQATQMATLEDLYTRQGIPERTTYTEYLDLVQRPSREPSLKKVPSHFKTRDLCNLAVSVNPKNIRDIPKEKQTPQQQHMACSNNPFYIEHMPEDQDRSAHMSSAVIENGAILEDIQRRHLCGSSPVMEIFSVCSWPYAVSRLPSIDQPGRTPDSITQALDLIAVLSYPLIFSEIPKKRYTIPLLKLKACMSKEETFEIRKDQRIIKKSDGSYYTATETTIGGFTKTSAMEKLEDYTPQYESDSSEFDSEEERENSTELTPQITSVRLIEVAVNTISRPKTHSARQQVKERIIYLIGSTIFWNQQLMSKIINKLNDALILNLGHFRKAWFTGNRESLLSLMMKAYPGMENISEVSELSKQKNHLKQYKEIYQIFHPVVTGGKKTSDLPPSFLAQQSIFGNRVLKEQIMSYLTNYHATIGKT